MGCCCSQENDKKLSNEVANADTKKSELTPLETKSETKSETKLDTKSDGDSEMARTVTNQFIAEFANVLFGDINPDPTRYKLLFAGRVGPQVINWDNKNGDVQIMNFCNQMSSYNGIFYIKVNQSIINAYQIAIQSIPPTIPMNLKPFEDAQKALAEANKELDAQVKQLNTDWQNWIKGQKAKGLTLSTYPTWEDYAKSVEPDDYSQYKMYLVQQASAQDTYNTISGEGETGPVKEAVESFGKWHKATHHGMVQHGNDKVFWDVSGNIKQSISNWKQGTYSGAGQFIVTNDSSTYTKTTISPKFSFLFDVFAIGGNGCGSCIWRSNSEYNIKIKWKASGSTNFTPPSVYNFALIKLNRTNVYSNQQPYNPLTGTDNSPFQNIPKTAYLIFGVSIEAKFDKLTYESIKTQANEGVVSFGIFSIGKNVPHTNTKFNDESFSFIATADTEAAYLAGLQTDPLV